MNPSLPSVLRGNPQVQTIGASNLNLTPKTSRFNADKPPVDPFVQFCRPSIEQLVGGQIRPAISMEKIWINANMRRAKYYWEGTQYLTIVNSNGLYDYRPISPPGSSLSVTFQEQNLEQFSDYVLNIFRGDVRAFISVLGTRAPNVQAAVRDPNDGDQVSLKRLADRFASYL